MLIYIHFSALSLKFSVYFILYLNLDAEFSLEILHLCLDFIKFPVEKIDSNTQIVPYIFRNFPVTELRAKHHFPLIFASMFRNWLII